jgi:hypothetical protein
MTASNSVFTKLALVRQTFVNIRILNTIKIRQTVNLLIQGHRRTDVVYTSIFLFSLRREHLQDNEQHKVPVTVTLISDDNF